MRRKAIIYALRDPVNGTIRYIGKTVNPDTRLAQHMKTTLRSPINLWCRNLKAQKQEPVMSTLAIVEQENCAAAETAWIAFGRAANWPLLNVSNGGEGCFNTAEYTGYFLKPTEPAQ